MSPHSEALSDSYIKAAKTVQERVFTIPEAFAAVPLPQPILQSTVLALKLFSFLRPREAYQSVIDLENLYGDKSPWRSIYQLEAEGRFSREHEVGDAWHR